MELRVDLLKDFKLLENFECGVKQMDDFIHDHLQSCNDNHYCTTYAAVDISTARVAGLFALSFDSVTLDGGDFEDMRIGAATTDILDVDESFRERLESKTVYPALEITYIAVSKDYQRMGVGSELVDAVVKKAKTQNMSGCLFLTVNALHTPQYSAVAFYEKCRFAILTPTPQQDIWPMYKTLWVRP